MNIFQYGLGIVTVTALIYIAVSGYHWHKGTQSKNENRVDLNDEETREEVFLKRVAEIDKELLDGFREYLTFLFQDIFKFLTQGNDLSVTISFPFYCGDWFVTVTRGWHNEAIISTHNSTDLVELVAFHRRETIANLHGMWCLPDTIDVDHHGFFEDCRTVFNNTIEDCNLVKDSRLNEQELNFYMEVTRSKSWPWVFVAPEPEQKGELSHLNALKTNKFTELLESLGDNPSGYTDYLIRSFITAPLEELDKGVKECFLEHISRKSNVVEHDNFTFGFGKETVSLGFELKRREKELIEKYTTSLDAFGHLAIPVLNNFFSSFLAKFEQEADLVFLKDLTTVKVGKVLMINGVNCGTEKTFTYTFFLGKQ